MPKRKSTEDHGGRMVRRKTGMKGNASKSRKQKSRRMNSKLKSKVKSIVKSVLNKQTETKYVTALPLNGNFLDATNSGGNPYVINPVSILSQGIGIQQYIGRSVDIRGIKVSLSVENWIRCIVNLQTVTVAPKQTLYVNLALVESSHYTLASNAFFLAGGTGDIFLGRQGATNNALHTNFSGEKCKVKYHRKWTLPAGNTDHENTHYSADQCVKTLVKDIWIPYKRKIKFENNATGDATISGDNFYLLLYIGAADPSQIIENGKVKLNYTMYYKDA